MKNFLKTVFATSFIFASNAFAQNPQPNDYFELKVIENLPEQIAALDYVEGSMHFTNTLAGFDSNYPRPDYVNAQSSDTQRTAQIYSRGTYDLTINYDLMEGASKVGTIQIKSGTYGGFKCQVLNGTFYTSETRKYTITPQLENYTNHMRCRIQVDVTENSGGGGERITKATVNIQNQ